MDGSNYDPDTSARINKVDGFDNSGIFSIGLNAKLIDKLALNAMYLKSNADIKYINDELQAIAPIVLNGDLSKIGN